MERIIYKKNCKDAVSIKLNKKAITLYEKQAYTLKATLKAKLSSGHRGNMLDKSFAYFGVGGAAGGTYGDYYTQNFYKNRKSY